MSKLFKITIMSVAAILYAATNLLASKTELASPANIVTNMFEDGTSKNFWAVKSEQTEFLKNITSYDEQKIYSEIVKAIKKCFELDKCGFASILNLQKITIPSTVEYVINGQYACPNKEVKLPFVSSENSLTQDLANIHKILQDLCFQKEDLQVIYLSLIHHAYFKEFEIEYIKRRKDHGIFTSTPKYSELQVENHQCTLFWGYHDQFAKDLVLEGTCLWKKILDNNSSSTPKSISSVSKAFNLSFTLNCEARDYDKVQPMVDLYDRQHYTIMDELIKSIPRAAIDKTIQLWGGSRSANGLVIQLCLSDIDNLALKEQLQATEARIEKIQKEKDEHQKHQETLNNQIKILTDEKDKQKTALKELREQLKKLNARTQKRDEKLQQKVGQLKEENHKLAKDNEQLSVLNKKLSEGATLSKSMSDGRAQMNEQLRKEIVQLKDEKKKFAKDHEKLSMQHKKLSEDATISKSKAEERTILTDQLQDRNNTLTKQISDLSQEKDILESQVRQLTEQLNAETEKSQQFGEANKQLIDQIENQKKPLKSTRRASYKLEKGSSIPTTPSPVMMVPSFFYPQNPMQYPMSQPVVPVPAQEFQKFYDVAQAKLKLEEELTEKETLIKDQNKKITQLIKGHEKELLSVKEKLHIATVASQSKDQKAAHLSQTVNALNTQIAGLCQQLQEANYYINLYKYESTNAQQQAIQSQNNFNLLLEKNMTTIIPYVAPNGSTVYPTLLNLIETQKRDDLLRSTNPQFQQAYDQTNQ
jgi:hypothetical protein